MSINFEQLVVALIEADLSSLSFCLVTSTQEQTAVTHVELLGWLLASAEQITIVLVKQIT
jgi:hypothetical protein